jgi:hypothetical protein
MLDCKFLKLLRLTEAVPTAFSAAFATRFMIGATFVGPYN